MEERAERLGVLDAAVVVVGIVFGSGIFLAPQTVALACGSRFAALLAWPAAALVAACGSMCYAECISRVGAAGGFYAVFRRTYGPAFAHAAGLTAQLVISPTTLAGPVAIGGGALSAAFFGASRAATLGCALGLLLLAAACNVLGVHFSRLAQRVFVGAKVSLVAFLVLACLISQAGLRAAAAPPVVVEAGGVPALEGTALLASFLGVLLWTFDGWTDATLVAPRLRRPGIELSRALMLGLFSLAGIFVAVQFAVMQILGVAGTAASPRPFAAAIEAVFGPNSRPLVDGAIVLSTFTSAHAVMWMVSSLTQVMSAEGALPRTLAATDRRLGRPWCCVGFVAALAGAWCLALGDFAAIVDLFSFFIWVFYGLMAASLFLLRRWGVRTDATWTAPGGPVAPMVVSAVALTMTGSHLLAHPAASLACLGAFAAVVAACALRRTRPTPSTSS